MVEVTDVRQTASSDRCAVCQAALRRDVRVRLNGMRLVACPVCQSWTYLPRPSTEQQAAIHDAAEYFDHPYFQHRRHAQRAIDRRCRQIFQQLQAGVDLATLRGDRILDVGCDTGAFLASAAQQFGMVPQGVDVATRAVEMARSHGIDAYATTLEDAPAHLSRLSVITAIDLIEHVVDPRSLLTSIFQRLRPGGVTYLETPNIRSSVYQVGRLLCRLTAGRPVATFERLFPPQHIQYFTRESFTAMACDCGFEVVRLQSRPLPFADLATSLPIRVGLTGLQVVDQLTGNGILLCALLRRPEQLSDP